MPKLLIYTRQPIDNIYYDPKLAYSMHLGIYSEKGYAALNHNSGVLFVRGTENEDGSINAMSLKKPFVFNKGNEYGILAVRTLGEGEDDDTSKGSVVYFTTRDFVHYREEGLIKLAEDYVEDCACTYNHSTGIYEFVWLIKGRYYTMQTTSLQEKGPIEVCDISEIRYNIEQLRQVSDITTDIEGAQLQQIIDITKDEEEYLIKKLTTPRNIGMEYDDNITVRSGEDIGKKLSELTVIARYSDGSTAPKKVDWDSNNLSTTGEGDFIVKGKVHKEHYEFPIAFNRADPCIGKWKDKYYFIATNDADMNHTLYIREASSIPELVNAKEHLILDTKTYEDIGGLLWAPEFHIIDGKMYIFHAATKGEFFCEESHIMELKDGKDPKDKDGWTRPRRSVRADGSDICEAGKEITLDMTCFYWEGDYYVVWSQRQFLPKDLGAWLYIAKLDRNKPYKLLTDPVVLSKPDYGWANNHTFVDEGPFALVKDDTLYLTFSSAAVDTSYVVGLLSIKKGQNLLDASNWSKSNYPILTSRSVEGEYGTGHNAYVSDEDGNIWNTYHARPGVKGDRSSGIRRVHFDFEGELRLDVTEDLDVAKDLEDVIINVKVRKEAL